MEEFSKTELAHERWKPIFGYDGMYEVSSLGRVRSLKYGKTRVLRASKNNSGYLIVALCKNSKRKSVYVHRLVAQAFIENDNIFNTEINHINEDKTDNKVSNLEYCDRQYNMTYNGLQQRRTANYHRSNYKLDKIKNLYRPDLSIKQNLEIFKANGVNCSIVTLWKLRKDLGLVKHKAN